MYKKVLCIIFLCLFLFNTNASGFLEITETGKQHNIEKIQTELNSIPCVIQSEIKSSDEYDPDCLTFTIKITMSDNRYLEIENYYALTKYFNETRIKQINDLIPLKWVCGVIDKKKDLYNYRYYVSELSIKELEANSKLSINGITQLIDNFDSILCFINSLTEFSDDIPFGDIGYFPKGEKPILIEWDKFYSSYENEIQINKDNSWKYVKLFKTNSKTYNNWMILHNQKFRVIKDLKNTNTESVKSGTNCGSH